MAAAHAAAEVPARGYIVTEDNDLALADLAGGLNAIAMLTEERPDDMPEIPKSDWAGLLRTFARQASAIRDGALFANKAMARPRHLN